MPRKITGTGGRPARVVNEWCPYDTGVGVYTVDAMRPALRPCSLTVPKENLLKLPPSTMANRNSTSGNPAERQVGVLTVDDQEVFRALARLVVEATPGFESLGEVASGEEALPAVDNLNPDLVLIDVRMPGMNGIETARRITAAHPGTVVVLISVEDPVDIPSAAEASGAVALVRKENFKPALLCELWATHGHVQQ
jgi:CheY-like chemotaxis protein